MTDEIVSSEMDIDISEMDKDVDEYTAMEQKVTQDFLQGLIKLGSILKAHRDKWKPKKKYLEYLSRINRSVSATNQIIRIYEYSIEEMSKLVAANLTNWNKVNMFLSLPEDMKDKLAEEIDGEDVTSEEFREKITEVKEEAGEVIDDPLLPVDMKEMEDFIVGTTSIDTEFMAKQIIQELRNNNVGDFSENCVPIASGFLCVEKALKYFSTEKFKALTLHEKKFWNKIVRSQLDRLNKLLK